MPSNETGATAGFGAAGGGADVAHPVIAVINIRLASFAIPARIAILRSLGTAPHRVVPISFYLKTDDGHRPPLAATLCDRGRRSLPSRYSRPLPAATAANASDEGSQGSGKI